MSRTGAAETTGGVELVIADLEDGSDLTYALAGVNALIHLTSPPSTPATSST